MTIPKLVTKTSPGGGRWYRDPVTTDYYPSVTNLIDLITQKNFAGWAIREAEKYLKGLDKILYTEGDISTALKASETFTKFRASIGTAVHDAVDKYCRQEPVTVFKIPGYDSRLLANKIEGVIQWMKDYNAYPIETEFTVIKQHRPSKPPHTRGWMGTADGLFMLNNNPNDLILVDFKTSKSSNVENKISSWWYQLLALKSADSYFKEVASIEDLDPNHRNYAVKGADGKYDSYWSKKEMPLVTKCAVIHLPDEVLPDGKYYKQYIMPADNPKLDAVKLDNLHLAAQIKWNNKEINNRTKRSI